MSTDPADPKHPTSAGVNEPLVQPLDGAPRDELSPAAGAELDTPDAPPAERESAAAARSRERRGSRNMLPGRERRRTGVERLLVRLIATCGIVGIGVAIAAIMVSNKSQGWVVGLVVSIVSVVLAAVLWSSRQL
jgi:hypothetical protein